MAEALVIIIICFGDISLSYYGIFTRLVKGSNSLVKYLALFEKSLHLYLIFAENSFTRITVVPFSCALRTDLTASMICMRDSFSLPSPFFFLAQSPLVAVLFHCFSSFLISLSLSFFFFIEKAIILVVSIFTSRLKNEKKPPPRRGIEPRSPA